MKFLSDGKKTKTFFRKKDKKLKNNRATVFCVLIDGASRWLLLWIGG